MTTSQMRSGAFTGPRLGSGGNRHSGEAPTQYCPRSFQIGTAGAATIVAAGLAARLGEQRTGRRQQVSVDTGTAAAFRARSYSYPEKGPRTRRDLKAPGNAPARMSGRGVVERRRRSNAVGPLLSRTR